MLLARRLFVAHTIAVLIGELGTSVTALPVAGTLGPAAVARRCILTDYCSLLLRFRPILRRLHRKSDSETYYACHKSKAHPTSD